MNYPLNYTPSFKRYSVQTGSTGSGFLAGLLLGLIMSLVVAFYVTNAPLPFANKTGKLGEKWLPKAGADLPDPNRSLYGKDVKNGHIPTEEKKSGAMLVTPLPPQSDDQIIPVTPATSQEAASLTGQTQPNPPFYLQTGSFKNIEDAEQLRARLALAGVEANLSQAEINGKQLNRVRVGPFANAEEAYKARSKLTENGFEAKLMKSSTPDNNQ